MRITIETPVLNRLGAEWRALEAQGGGSFFQSWSWIGCGVAQRFNAPRLIRARVGGQTVGFGLFNRRPLTLAPRALWLHQTGVPAEDSVFIEHNAPLVAPGHDGAIAAILRAARQDGGVVVLGGVGAAVMDGLGGLGRVSLRAQRAAPYADLGDEAGPWLARRGAATRAQLARSRRRFAAIGALNLRRAGSVAEALEFLDGLARLHQAGWQRRRRPGAFAEPAFGRFHAELVARALPRGEVALWRLAVDARPVAYLYNFCWRRQMLAYQSGLDTEWVPRASPGLLAHAMVMTEARREGFERYDFLAGDMRYKRELADGAVTLHWVELAGRLQARGWYHVAARAFASGGPQTSAADADAAGSLSADQRGEDPSLAHPAASAPQV